MTERKKKEIWNFKEEFVYSRYRNKGYDKFRKR